MQLLDLHTHRTSSYPEGIICVEPRDVAVCTSSGQLCSVGLHPWYLSDSAEGVSQAAEELAKVATKPCVVAIGEAGFDTVRGGAIMLQTLAFRKQMEISEQLGKPLIIHAVKALDMILSWRKESKAKQEWIIHGFRGKPQVAMQLLKSGCSFSFGEHFNADTLRSLPDEAIFAETDESMLPITEIINCISQVRGKDMMPIIASNMMRLFPKQAELTL